MAVVWALVGVASAALGLWQGQVMPLVVSVAILGVRHWRRVASIVRTLPRDINFLVKGITAFLYIKRRQKLNSCFADIFDERLRAHPHKVLFKFNEADWTFQRVADYSNRVANAFARLGYKKGDVVALLMANCPEYVAVWLGLSKLGVITALVNHNQRGKALQHSLSIAKCRAVVFGAEFYQAVQDVKADVDDSLEMLQLLATGESAATPASVKDMNALLDDAPATESTVQRPGYRDILVYIYTSGTTGLPKAAKITHSRYIAAGVGIPMLVGIARDEVVYCPLPLYHSAGGMCAVGYGLLYGMTVVIRPKFSASAFIPDCIKYKCTVVQYIGEICRYVLATGAQASDTQHRIHYMIGNGMRTTVWQSFVDRFRIKHVVELYGSTEGNVTFFNFDNTVGAVGFMPRILPLSMSPIGFVRVDEAGDVVRGADGLCQRCDIGEPGMLVGHISDTDPSREFHGYVDKASSEKKVLRDVYQRGDKWFMTGDVLVMDELGYIYFRDRTGDTFRWKGENVSTAEVEAAVMAAVGQRDIAVYGVEVAGAEGRAGMAAVADTEGLDLEALARVLDSHLPTYARPLFLRTPPSLQKTSTYKIIKVAMQKEGYDPSVVKDPLFLRQGATFVPLTPQMHQDVCSGKLRL